MDGGSKTNREYRFDLDVATDSCSHRFPGPHIAVTQNDQPPTFSKSWFGNDLLGILRRQTIPFIVVFALGVAMTVAVIVFAPRKYRSQAKLLVKIGRENASLDPTITTTGETVNVHRTRENEISTTLEVMRSRQLVEDVVEEIGDQAILDGFVAGTSTIEEDVSPLSGLKSALKSWIPTLDPISSREKAILELKDSLDISTAKDASVVAVDYRTKSPEMANLVTATWVKNYLQRHARLNATEGSLEFFDRQAESLDIKLRQARERLGQIKQQSGIMTIAGAQQTLEQQLQTAGQSLIASKTQLAAAKARVDAIRRSLGGTDSKMVLAQEDTDVNDAVLRMRDRLFALEIEQRDLQSRLKANHPTLAAMKEQVDEAREVLASQQSDSSTITEGVNPMFVTMSENLATEKASVEAHTAEVAAIESEIDLLHDARDRLNQQETEIAGLEQELLNLQIQQQTQFEKHEQARLAAALETSEISNVNVIQSATLEERPVTPNKKLCAMLGLIGSLLAALGLTTVREAARQPLIAQRTTNAPHATNAPQTTTTRPSSIDRQTPMAGQTSPQAFADGAVASDARPPYESAPPQTDSGSVPPAVPTRGGNHPWLGESLPTQPR